MTPLETTAQSLASALDRLVRLSRFELKENQHRQPWRALLLRCDQALDQYRQFDDDDILGEGPWKNP